MVLNIIKYFKRWRNISRDLGITTKSRNNDRSYLWIRLCIVVSHIDRRIRHCITAEQTDCRVIQRIARSTSDIGRQSIRLKSDKLE